MQLTLVVGIEEAGTPKADLPRFLVLAAMCETQVPMDQTRLDGLLKFRAQEFRNHILKDLVGDTTKNSVGWINVGVPSFSADN